MKPHALAALLVLAAMAPAYAQDDDDPPSLDDTPHIAIVGTASREVAPDLATITLGVTRHAPTAVAAADAVATAAQDVVAAAKAQGVEDADIATRSVELIQTFDEQRDPQGGLSARRPSGFDASETLSIRVHDLSRTGSVSQTLIDKGANAFDGISFTLEHPQPVLDQLAAEATANARRQAELVTKAAGVKLGAILKIESPDADTPKTQTVAPAFASATTLRASIPAQAGTTTLTVQMLVVWALDR